MHRFFIANAHTNSLNRPVFHCRGPIFNKVDDKSLNMFTKIYKVSYKNMHFMFYFIVLSLAFLLLLSIHNVLTFIISDA